MSKPSLRDVAQLGSASALGAEGRRFESCHPEIFFKNDMLQAGFEPSLKPQESCHPEIFFKNDMLQAGFEPSLKPQESGYPEKNVQLLG
jgi:hypothetical protein